MTSLLFYPAGSLSSTQKCQDRLNIFAHLVNYFFLFLSALINIFEGTHFATGATISQPCLQFPCFSSSPWIPDRCQAMEVILSFPASASLADSSGNYVHSFKAVSSSASWLCCFWLVAVSSHLPCPSHGLDIALKIQELDHLHLPLSRAQIKQYPVLFFKHQPLFYWKLLLCLWRNHKPLSKSLPGPPGSHLSKPGECVATTTDMMGKPSM